MSREIVIVRYGEVALKGANRAEFERRLKEGVKVALRGLERGAVDRTRGRILVRDVPDATAAAARVARVFGCTSASPGVAVERELGVIREAAVARLERALARRGVPDGDGLAMRVETRRADKSFPHRSMEVTLAVADAIKTRFPKLGVRMKGQDVTVGIEVRHDGALVFVDRFDGPGGLPLGSQGKGLALLSGGIDSPVAAWLAMKRGLLLECVYFHSAPFTGDAAKQKAIDLASVLATWSGAMRLHVLPLADVQVAIKKLAPETYRTLLYRRAMNRIAARVADLSRARCFVTGESLGQVASQTVANLECIEDSADRLVLRPLVTFDKSEIVALARTIGTLEISERPHPDCCSLFQPSKPKIRGEVEEAREIESRIDLAPLEERSFENREVIVVRPDRPGIRIERPANGSQSGDGARPAHAHAQSAASGSAGVGVDSIGTPGGS